MKNKNLKLKPLKTMPKTLRLGSFDIETYSDENLFYMGSCIHKVKNHGGNRKTNTDDYEIKVFYDKEEMIKYMTDERFTRNFNWYATNLSFDILSLFEETEYFSQLKLLFRNTRLLQARYEHTNKERRKFVFFNDTLNHSRLSVFAMGKLLGIPKYETPSFIGQIPEDDADKKILEEYNIRDSFITLKFAEFLQENYNKTGASMKMTLPSSSMDLFRRKYLKEELIRPDIKTIEYLFKGYYGGRTEAIKRGNVSGRNLKLYDINSLYPTAMMLYDFPHPNHYYYKKYKKNDLHQINNYDGVAQIIMKCPDGLHIPYLPVRMNNKLIFPAGIIKGHYTFFEIREAIKMGYKVIKIIDSITYTQKHNPFKEFVTDLYNERMRLKIEKNPTEHIMKIFLNSLYGKFAQKIEPTPDIHHIDSIDNLNELMGDEDLEVSVIGKFVYVKKKSIGRIPLYINPIYSIYVTAYARHILYNSLPEDVYYMDTDSCITGSELETGSYLGEWKKEDEIDEGIIIKPKFYYINELVKAKGCGKMNVDDFKELLITNKYQFTKFTKFKESIRRDIKFNKIMELEKHFDLEDNKRQWDEKFNHNELQVSNPLILNYSDYEK